MTKKVDINALRRERSEVQAKVAAIASKETAGDQLSAADIAEFETLQSQFDELTGVISRTESAERMAIEAAKPVDKIEASKSKVWQTPKAPEVKGAKVAKMIRALGQAGGNTQMAAKIAGENFNDADVAMALTTTTSAGGGVLIPAQFVPEVIELLSPQSVVREMGALTMPMPNGNLTIPKLTGGAAVGYIGSDDDIASTGATFGDLQLSAKKLAALVPISNDLIKYSGTNQNVDRVVIGDLIAGLGAREDKAFIRDDGSANTPKGLRYWAPAQNVIAANATVNLQNVENDLGKIMLMLMNANTRMRSPGWVLNPTVFMFLSNLRDGNGNKVYPELVDGLLKGYPYKTTTQVPANLGVGGDESEVYFVDFADAIIGESDEMTIAISTEATYKDESSNLISAFSKDQTLIRVIQQHDFGMRHDGSVAVLTGVTWQP